MGTSRHFARAIAVIVVATGCLAAVPDAAQAVPGTPGGLTATAANPPVLSWARATSAVKYDVQVDDDPAFVSPEFTLNTVNTRAVPTIVLHAGQQFWRVRAYDAAGLVGPWAQSSFTIDEVPEPTNLSPDGTTLQQPGSPPLLSWDEVRGAEAYVVQLDDEEDTDYVGAREYTTKVTSLVVPEALPTGDDGESYRWRVKAIRDAGVESAFSDDATFTLNPIDAVTLVSPADDAVVQDVVLDWQPLPGAQYYELQVSTDDNFSVSTVIDDRTGRNHVLGTRYSPPVTYDNNTYYWRVRAVDTAGNPSAWSDDTDLRSFVRAWAAPHVPRLLAPGDGANRGPGLHLQWTPVRHASMYEVQMSPDPAFSPGPALKNCNVLGTTYTPGTFSINDLTGTTSISAHDACNPSAGIRYYWRVRPLDLPFARQGTGTNGVQGIYSEIRSFIFKSAPVDGSAVDMVPANGATVDVPVLSWDSVQGVDRYEINVWDRTGAPVVVKKKTAATSYVPVVQTALTAEKSPYEWSLTGFGKDGTAKTLEMHRTFSISGDDPDEGPWAGSAAPLTPLTANTTTTATHRPPLMAWEPYPGAAYYRVFAGPADSGTLFPQHGDDVFGSDTKLAHPAATDTHTWLLDPGEYEWTVVAYASDNSALDSSDQPGRFRIGALDPVSGIRLAIDGNTFGADGNGGFTAPVSCTPSTCGDAPSTPVISWDPVEDAGMYLVYLSEDPEFTNVVENLTALPATTNTRWTPNFGQQRSALAESLAGGSYYLHVRPCIDATHCAPRPVSTTGMATNKFRKKSPAVVLQQPTADKQVSTTEIVFDWEDYRTTSADPDSAWSETGEAGAQSAMWYRLQVDDNSNFASPIDEIRVDQSTYTAFAKLYPEGPLYWRVQAIDGDANDLTWSEARKFEKKTPSVELTAPAPDSVRHGTTVFRWESDAFAASYDIELYKNNDTTFSSANRLFGKSVKQTAYVWSEVIPSSTVKYVWRVRSVDPMGNKGPWSAASAFTSAVEEPQVEGPPSGSYLQGDEMLLRWTSVPGATSYEVELMAPTGTTAERTDTKATAYAPFRTLNDGTWQWKVVAESASGTQIGSSGWSTFVIDENGPRVVNVGPSTVRLRSSILVTFNEPVKNISGQTVFLKRDGSRRKVGATVTLSADKLRATLNPNRNLRPTSYTLRITAGVTDLRDNKLAPYSRGIRPQ